MANRVFRFVNFAEAEYARKACEEMNDTVQVSLETPSLVWRLVRGCAVGEICPQVQRRFFVEKCTTLFL